MYVLGVSHGHDASACMVKDGKLIAAAEEERFNRIKHSVGYDSPVLAAKFCLDFAGIGKEDIDYVAVDMENPYGMYSEQLMKLLKPRCIANAYALSAAMRLMVNTYKWKFQGNPFNLGDMGIPADRFRFIRHHDAHAASAFRCSGFQKSGVVVMDGVGETDATSFYEAEGDTITPTRRIAIPDSLGLWYGAFTMLLGYEFAEGEGKVMGLAPYGESSRYYDKMKTVCIDTKDGYKINRSYAKLDKFPMDMDLIKKEWGDEPKDPKNLHLQKKYRDIAWAMQKRLEEVVLRMIKDANIGDTLSLAGGIAMNCKMNGLILHESGIKDIFVQPGSSDVGGSIGAALELAHRLGCKTKFKMRHAYLGPGFTDEQIEKHLTDNKLDYEYHKDIEGKVAELLAKNKIVAWFQGRMEFGARALGNRSILMSPADQKNKDVINDTVKFREPYRPFCPSMLAEAADEYLEEPYESPFMILSFQVPKEKRREIPSVVHVDGSCRPQTVEKDVNPRYWKLIKKFEGLTGVPVLLNTSFNIKGEPMICRPKEAVSCFYNTGIDYLAMGNYLLSKK